MKVREFFELLDCSVDLTCGFVAALFTGDRELFDATQARVERIHAGIDQRKTTRHEQA